MKRLITSILILTACIGAMAAADSTTVLRPVLSAWTLKAGSAHIAETYLSPLRYSGQGFGVDYERMQAMRFDPQRWVMDLRIGLDAAHTSNPVRNASMWSVSLDAGWGMMRRFRLDGGWSLYAGGTTDISFGALYNVRNGNNPVAAKASWTVGAMGAAAWNGRIGRLPVCLRYMVSMPLTGIFFSPQYGELYYEIYLGNHSGLVRAAWPGNFFRLDNLLCADLRFGATIVRVGYGPDIISSKASDIVTRNIRHMAVVGFTSEWLSLSTKPLHTDEAEIISALY